MGVTQCTIAHALEKTKYPESDIYWKKYEEKYHFSSQFTADILAMNHSDFLGKETSTSAASSLMLPKEEIKEEVREEEMDIFSDVSYGEDMDAREHVIKKHKGQSFDLKTPHESCEKSKEQNEQKQEVELVNINGYKMKGTTAPILEAIFAKYGDITTNCSYRSLSVKTSLLEVLTNTVLTLKSSDIEAVLANLETIENEISDVEASKIEVAWLHENVEKLRKVAACRDKSLQLREDIVTSGIATNLAGKEVQQIRDEMTEAYARFLKAEKLETSMKLVSRKIEDNIMSLEAEESFLIQERLNELPLLL